jgi:hypothetical protein
MQVNDVFFDTRGRNGVSALLANSQVSARHVSTRRHDPIESLNHGMVLHVFFILFYFITYFVCGAAQYDFSLNVLVTLTATLFCGIILFSFCFDSRIIIREMITSIVIQECSHFCHLHVHAHVYPLSLSSIFIFMFMYILCLCRPTE